MLMMSHGAIMSVLHVLCMSILLNASANCMVKARRLVLSTRVKIKSSTGLDYAKNFILTGNQSIY
jgi:hypothetical protein